MGLCVVGRVSFLELSLLFDKRENKGILKRLNKNRSKVIGWFLR